MEPYHVHGHRSHTEVSFSLQDSKITMALRLWTGKTSEVGFRAWRLFTQQAIAAGVHADDHYVLKAW